VAEGAKVELGDILDEEGKAVADELGDAARYVHLDVTSPDDWTAAVQAAVTEFGGLNVLFNNAGIANGATIQRFSLEKWQKIIDINLTGPFLGIRAAADALIAAGGGSIINTSSIEGLRGTSWAHGYVASKWGLRGLTKSVAMELAPHGVRVNSLHPGLIRTPLTDGIPDDMIPVPLGRPGLPEDVASFVVFLASDESSYATGTEFVIDGGTVNQIPHK
jgi:3alpha(or 20beta)-hydroxysteroid dehydrogenase